MADIKFNADEIPQAFEFANEQAYWQGFLAGVKASAEHALQRSHQKILATRKPEQPQEDTAPKQP